MPRDPGCRTSLICRAQSLGDHLVRCKMAEQWAWMRLRRLVGKPSPEYLAGYRLIRDASEAARDLFDMAAAELADSPAGERALLIRADVARRVEAAMSLASHHDGPVNLLSPDEPAPEIGFDMPPRICLFVEGISTP